MEDMSQEVKKHDVKGKAKTAANQAGDTAANLIDQDDNGGDGDAQHAPPDQADGGDGPWSMVRDTFARTLRNRTGCS